MTNNTDPYFPSQTVHAGASLCPSCGAVGEFDLPADHGQFEIACYECDHIYEINAEAAIETAVMRDLSAPRREQSDDEMIASASDSQTTITCMKCDGTITITGLDPQSDDFDPQCPHCGPDALAAETLDDLTDNLTDNLTGDAQAMLATTRFSSPPMLPAKSGRTSIILVSIFSAALIISAAAIALGLYFLTLRADSDVARYIETNVLQLAPASFSVRTATYEISETDLGKSLLVTISVTNTGQVEGAPEDLKITLTDANDQALVTWPLDATNQIIAPGETTQLYTRLFEPPESFANLRVFMR